MLIEYAPWIAVSLYIILNEYRMGRLRRELVGVERVLDTLVVQLGHYFNDDYGTYEEPL